MFKLSYFSLVFCLLFIAIRKENEMREKKKKEKRKKKEGKRIRRKNTHMLTHKSYN
jgi:large-conductance mechanosensitive channel